MPKITHEYCIEEGKEKRSSVKITSSLQYAQEKKYYEIEVINLYPSPLIPYEKHKIRLSHRQWQVIYTAIDAANRSMV